MKWSTLVFLTFWSTLATAAEDKIPRPEHPTPDAMRKHWSNLNGTWDFRFDAQDQGVTDKWFEPKAEGYDRKIVVPFCWESELSGIHKVKGAPKVGWYRRDINVPADFPKDQRVWLRFGAVDEHADVWLNGKKVLEHDGGYSPFEADITDAVNRDGDNVLVVRAYDPTDPSHPTGKQVGWYTTTSGIWQTVWLESRPKTYIKGFNVRTTLEPTPRAIFDIEVVGDAAEHRLKIDVRGDDPTVKRRGESEGGKVELEIADAKLWSPDSPHLYDANIELKDDQGNTVDSIKTYFGLREIKRGKLAGEDFERIFLNGTPIYLRGALDQSFNPKGIYTGPTDDFLRKDIEDSKKLGLNFLRIHIKPDEPRRLYWADKLGLLIMEDMPNAWKQNPESRKTWEHTMREVLPRDRNHPAIFAWIAFNETWGLVDPQYKKDKDTQNWVKSMLSEIRKLDPTRLVEDNSPCNYDHIEGSDLNSWHFYIDDHEGAKRHIDDVVARSVPGSSFNYVPGQTMNSAPLINSEYGSVSAGGGDRDVSWGFRDLTTLLRKQPKIQGYVYTELSDIEWEHNGFLDYDRSPKEFGYGAFVKGMTPADLQGADFVGYDSPPAIVAKVGETVAVPVFVSHYSQRKEPPILRWWVKGTNDDGELDEIPAHTRKVDWKPYGVTTLEKPLQFKIKSSFVGALALVLEDAKTGEKIAANFVNIVIQPETPRARVERVLDHEVALRFTPEEFSRSRWTDGSKMPGVPGKAAGQGKGSFTYKLKVPQSVVLAKPEAVELLLEVSAKSGRDQVDWNDHVNPQDNPQTDARKWPSVLEVSMNGQRIARVDLDDAPADARGVLSHLARVDHGSFGELIRLRSPLPETAKADLAAGRPLILRFTVPEDAKNPGGLTLFGATTGAFPFDPTLSLITHDALPAELGVKPTDSPAIDVSSGKQAWLIPAGDTPRGGATRWAYSIEKPADNWNAVDFDDSSWKRGAPGFGTRQTPGVSVRTRWNTPSIWLRTTFDMPKRTSGDSLSLHLFHDEDVSIFVNGKPLLELTGYVSSYEEVPLDAAQTALFHDGRNVVSVLCRQTGGGQGIDVGVSLFKQED